MTGQVDLAGDEYFALRTFRRDGSPVSAPIWLAPAEGRLYAYTPIRSWKVLRLRRDPRVEFAPSDFGGEPHGPWRTGRARVLPASELRVAKRAMTAKYRNKFRWFTIVTLLGRARKRGGRAVGLEITLDPAG
ncbi:PPOX class F420-dependent oxidoreductase [Amycolatopsis nigrescens]|uniref:PPOX class F420-dependent oxidoreductase n=1 Tax=Amycolatopsis nigrescens TaxID=381445 RepID=UPI00037A572C|nr:PPOX class F420-dependent oxidoreductase [Amycolatopsis nigrescens]